MDLAGDSDDDDFILPKFPKRRRVSPSEDSPLTSGGASTRLCYLPMIINTACCYSL